MAQSSHSALIKFAHSPTQANKVAMVGERIAHMQSALADTNHAPLMAMAQPKLVKQFVHNGKASGNDIHFSTEVRAAVHHVSHLIASDHHEPKQKQVLQQAANIPVPKLKPQLLMPKLAASRVLTR